MKVISSAARPSHRGPAEWFTGIVWLDEIAIGMPPSNLRIHTVTFSPGARTAWHTHPLGQVLHVVLGTGRVQKAGEPVRELCAGDSVWIAPNEQHWHGASPAHVFVHVAIQEATAAGEEATWFGHVTDADYQAPANSRRVGE